RSLRRSWMAHRFMFRVLPHLRTKIRFLRTSSFSNSRLPLNSRSSLNFLKRVSSFHVSVQTLLGVPRSRQLTMEGLYSSWQSPSQSLPIPADTLVPETHTYAGDSNFRPSPETSSECNLGHPAAKPHSIAYASPHPTRPYPKCHPSQSDTVGRISFDTVFVLILHIRCPHSPWFFSNSQGLVTKSFSNQILERL
ncbi:4-hydroxy-tetrahydrodipicolinate synthase, partial [Striga asiatica]